MKDILQNYIDLRAKSEKYGKNLVKTKPKFENVFAMIFNNSTMVLEVLDNYYRYWNKTHVGLTQQEIDSAKKENGQRVNEITKWSFIHTISSFEYSAKQIIKNSSNNQFQKLKNNLQTGKRVYMMGIMKTSKDSGLISDNDYDEWDGIIYLRNCLVHNNGVADKDSTLKIGTISVNCKKDKMIQGKLDTFYNLVDVSMELYNKWLQKN